jgi:hypothetical protein
MIWATYARYDNWDFVADVARFKKFLLGQGSKKFSDFKSMEKVLFSSDNL